MTHQTKPKLYRTVSVNDEDGVKGRLPEKNDWYSCKIFGFIGFHEREFKNGMFNSNGSITHWLEEVEPPKDNEIYDKMKETFSDKKQLEIAFIGAVIFKNLILNKK